MKVNRLAQIGLIISNILAVNAAFAAGDNEISQTFLDLSCVNANSELSLKQAADQLIAANSAVSAVMESAGPQDSSFAAIVDPLSQGWINAGALSDFKLAAKTVLGIDLTDETVTIEDLKNVLDQDLPALAEKIDKLKENQPGLHMFTYATLMELLHFVRTLYASETGQGGVAAQLINSHYYKNVGRSTQTLLADPIVQKGYFPLDYGFPIGDGFNKDWIAPGGVPMNIQNAYGTEVYIVPKDGEPITGTGVFRANGFLWVLVGPDGRLNIADDSYNKIDAIYVRRDHRIANELKMKARWETIAQENITTLFAEMDRIAGELDTIFKAKWSVDEDAGTYQDWRSRFEKWQSEKTIVGLRNLSKAANDFLFIAKLRGQHKTTSDRLSQMFYFSMALEEWEKRAQINLDVQNANRIE